MDFLKLITFHLAKLGSFNEWESWN